MIVEVADFLIRPGTEDAFDADIARGVQTVIAHASGYLRHQILRGIESPQRFLLVIEWETLEDHTEGFRGSEAFARWRAIVSPYFARPPQVEHFHRSAGGV
jgi:heme-degrading monooxygenase HmoA